VRSRLLVYPVRTCACACVCPTRQADEWLVPEVSGARPSARNAAVLAPLRPADGQARWLLHGGWRPFVQSYNDSFLVTLEGGK
jgi:hypothetical protein